jgi:hypothetical protein
MKKQGNRLRKVSTLLLIALLTLSSCGQKDNGEENTAAASYENNTTETDQLMYGVSNELSPDPENVKLEVPDYLCEEKVEYTVTALNQYVTKNGESKAYRYEISSEQLKGELNGFMEIHIPYDETFFEAGEDPAKCVCVHYVDEDGKLQLELFDVDTENNEVIIYAQHLSPREIYHYKTQKLAEKYDINFGNLIVGNVKLDESENVFIGFTKDIETDPGSWDGEHFEWTPEDTGNTYILAAKLAAAPYFPILFKVIPKNDNNLIYDTSTWISNAANLLSLGGPYVQSYINRGLSRLSVLGMYTSMCKLSYEFESRDPVTGKKTRDEVLSLYKTFINTVTDSIAYNYSDWIVESVSMYMAGVFIFGQLIDAMFEEAVYQKLWDIGQIYEYFGDSYTAGQYKARTNMEWYNLFMDIIERYIKAGKQDYIEDAIDREIYLYATKFWELDAATVGEVTTASGYKRMPWPTESEQKKLTDAYIENLKYRLHPIVNACMKTMEKKTELAVLLKMQDTYNNFNYKTPLRVYDANKEKKFGGYWFRFKKLQDDADPKIWKGQLDKDGQFTSQFSITDWIVAGQPTVAALYKTEQDMKDEKNAVTTAKIEFGAKAKDESTVAFLETDDLVWVMDTIVYQKHNDNYDTCLLPTDYECPTDTQCVVPAKSCVGYDVEIKGDSYTITKTEKWETSSEPEIYKDTYKIPPIVITGGKQMDEWAKEQSKESYLQFLIYPPEETDFSKGLGVTYMTGINYSASFEKKWPEAGKSVLISDGSNIGFVYKAMSADKAKEVNRKTVEMSQEEFFKNGNWR